MEFEKSVDQSNENFDESISIRNVLEKYIRHYKWFFLSTLVFLIFTIIKLRYEIPIYNVSASILIKGKNDSSNFSDLATYEDLGLVGSGGGNLENEIQILKSSKLIKNVVEELKLNIEYFVKDSPYDKEQFSNLPVTVNIIAKENSFGNISSNFKIDIISKNDYELIDFGGKSIGRQKFGNRINVNLGNDEELNYQDIVVILNENNFNQFLGSTVIVKISHIEDVARNYLSKLEIEPINERYSNVVTLSLNIANRSKGIAIINNLIEQYNADGINEKIKQSQSTIDFLDLRIGLISTELNAIESTAERFKSDKGVINVNEGADLFLASSTTNERELIQANTESQIISYLLLELDKTERGSLLPGNIGLSDPSINRKVTEYNDIVLQRNRILKSSSTLNPIIVNIDSQLNIIKSNLVDNLMNLQSSLEIRIQGLNRQRSKINTRIASAPKNEKKFKDIVREQETKNELYLFLLQKKEEAIVSSAANVEKAKVINEASSSGNAVSPKKILNLGGAIIIGLMIPFLVIYIRDLLDTKVHDQRDLENMKIPIIGDVPRGIGQKKVFVEEGDNSRITEAFRFIRTNINFLLHKSESGKIVFITSTKANEGKTYNAINLALSLAVSGKKTLLLAMDLRKPKIFQYLGIENYKGVTNYVTNDKLSLNELIVKSVKNKNLDILDSGDIPPNPVELLMSDRVAEIFQYSRDNYDFVIVDTAPVGMVTDTLQISKFADLTIYVIKANFLDKRLLHIPRKLRDDRKLVNMTFLINGSQNKGKSYGYEYGYGNVDKKKWYIKIGNYFKA